MLLNSYKIGDICQMERGLSPTLKTEPGQYPLVVTAAYRRTSITYQLEGPAVCIPLVSSTGHGDASLQRVHFQEGKFALANLLVALLPNPKICYAKYLYYLLTAKKDEILVPLMLGTANVSLKEKDIAAVEIDLPPLDEQGRIVARIEHLAAKVGKAEEMIKQSIAESETVLQSLLHDIFVTNVHHWKQKEFRSIVVMDDKQVDPTLPEYRSLPHISGENMESGTCRLLPHRTAEVDGVKSGNYLFNPGSVLYSKIRPYLRKAVFVNFQGVCSADVYPIRCDEKEIIPQFLKWSLIAQPFTDYANRLSGRTRMPKLNRKQLGSYILSYPSLNEQHKIATYLDNVQTKMDNIKAIYGKRTNELDALMPSILDKAFKGNL